ncbi:MAG: MFS transporter [Chlamydiales bacterium]|nr:MFS transporter [Chlamydiales bacterium]
MRPPKQKRPLSVPILMMLASFASVSAVLFTPALPEIRMKLQMSQAQVQLTMTAFLIGYALGNLPYGPIANRFGRKPAIYLGGLIAVIGCLLIVLVNSRELFWLFILGRFLMAIGSAVGMKVAFTMVGDVCDQTEATRKISSFIYAFALGPCAAIAIGGALTLHFGWQSCFYLLAGYSLLVCLLSALLPETLAERDTKALNFVKIKEGYLEKFRNKKLISCALIMGCMSAITYLFATEAPFIGIEEIGLTPYAYGLLTFIPAMGMIVGSLITRLLAGKKDPLVVMHWGSLLSVFISLLMLVLFLFEQVSVWTLFIPMPFLYVGFTFLFSNASALAMFHAKDKSNASSVMNFINMGMAVVALFFIEIIPIDKPYLLPLLFIVFALATLLLRRRLASLRA